MAWRAPSAGAGYVIQVLGGSDKLLPTLMERRTARSEG
jgi:hypothetical protein